MAVYEPDSSATAVILCKLTDISYKWGIESFRLVSEYKVKIKVLKPEGTSYADVIIPYYELPNNAMKENIIGLDASAYNLENGKIVRTKMKKDVVFKERVGESFPQLIHRIAIAPMLRDASELPGQPTPRFERRQSCVVRR